MQQNPPARRGGVVRALGLLWCAGLIAVMSTGWLSTARIGAMTFGPEHDIWSAAIAISAVNLGLPGKLAYKEVEQALSNELVSTRDVLHSGDPETERLLGDPATVDRALTAAAAVKFSDVAVPASKDGYVANWCEDLGYADFYAAAFRLFGFDARATHKLYFAVLVLSAGLFVLTYHRENLAVATLTLAVSALFLVSTSAIFTSSLPSFAANRFLSTLALIPMLHGLHAALRQAPLRWPEAAILVAQAMILAWGIAFRSSAQWCAVAIYGGIAAIWLIRARLRPRGRPGVRRGAARARLMQAPGAGRLAAIAAIVAAVTTVTSLYRSARYDERYSWEDNYPYHQFWHNAYIGLPENVDWKRLKPYPELSNYAPVDYNGYRVFERHMNDIGQPYLAPSGFYRARVYEPFIRGEYFKFLFGHPEFAWYLFTEAKPFWLRLYVDRLMVSIATGRYPAAAIGAGGVALILVLALFRLRQDANDPVEFAASVGIIWLASLLPPMLVYSVPNALADQLWSTLFLWLAVFAGVGAAAAAFRSRASAGLRLPYAGRGNPRA